MLWRLVTWIPSTFSLFVLGCPFSLTVAHQRGVSRRCRSLIAPRRSCSTWSSFQVAGFHHSRPNGWGRGTGAGVTCTGMQDSIGSATRPATKGAKEHSEYQMVQARSSADLNRTKAGWSWALVVGDAAWSWALVVGDAARSAPPCCSSQSSTCCRRPLVAAATAQE